MALQTTAAAQHVLPICYLSPQMLLRSWRLLGGNKKVPVPTLSWKLIASQSSRRSVQGSNLRLT